MDFSNLPNHKLGENYSKHEVFEIIFDIKEFYTLLSFSIMNFAGQGVKSMFNLDTYFFSSMSGTLDSIYEILIKGKINDSYALLRKFYDSTVINIYVSLYLNDKFSFENFIVEEIEKWRIGKETIPEYRKISKYIQDSNKLEPITKLLKKDNRYKKIRDRCNDHTHYNYFQNLLINDNQIYNENRLRILNVFQNDLINIFIQHFSYMAFLNEHYLMSSDYLDSLEIGIPPQEGSQYWVAPYIQKSFDDYIKKYRNDIAKVIIDKVEIEIQ